MIPRGIAILRRFLNQWIIESMLARTAPVTRVAVAFIVCMAIFVNDFIALGVITTVLFLVVFSSPGAAKRNMTIFFLPVAVGIIFAALFLIPEFRSAEKFVDMIMLLWKLCVLVLVAVVFDILVPQADFRYFIRTVPWPQAWVAVVAAVKSLEIGTWAVATVQKTTRTRSIRVWSTKAFLDAWVTALIAHFLEFLNSFQVSVRSRGLESLEFHPSKDVPEFNHIDLAVLAAVVLSFGLVIAL